ncbi:hypothetical protein LOD99_11473, partial [Oopsacas minuta]
MVLPVQSKLDRDLNDILSRYTSRNLSDCGKEVLENINHLITQEFLTLSNSLEISSGSEACEGEENSGRDMKDQARDDVLASGTQNTHRQFVTEDESVNLTDSQEHKYIESDHPPIYPSSSPTLSPPRVKQQARTRINELSKEIDTLKLGRGADAKTSVTQEKLEESLKECEENLDQFKEYKVKEFQEVLPNTSDEIEALSKSLSLLRI